MVFSQTSLKTQSILKVVDLNRLKDEKNPQVNGINGVITGGNSETALLSPVPTTSFSEVYLKPEPPFESKMFNESDCEFFQDLAPLFSGAAKGELVQTTDSLKINEVSVHNTDTLHTPFSPQGWDAIDVNSPMHVGYHNTTPNAPLSPNFEGFFQIDNKYLYCSELENENKAFQESMWKMDISNMPVVLGDSASEQMVDLNPYPGMEPVGYYHTHETDYIKPIDSQKMLYLEQEDSLDLKLNSVIPREVENNNVVISEYVIHNDQTKEGLLEHTRVDRRHTGLSLDVLTPLPWVAANNTISTPEVLSYVEQLEKEKCPLQSATVPEPWLLQETTDVFNDDSVEAKITPAVYEPITPKSESHESDVDDSKSSMSRRRRHDSEESDVTYTPHTEYTPRKYKRRKPNIPRKDLIMALKESQQLPKPGRGRPPKRRTSAVSSVCSIDGNSSSVSTQDDKYRVLRDKNNEASKRSRMNKKLKELQTEQLADDLEERNKKLKIKADILEDMTKRLKNALMTAILTK